MLKKSSLIFFALYFVLYEVTVYLSNDMIMPAMPAIMAEFHAPLSNVALSLSLYILGGNTLQFIIGPLADIIGKRKILIGGNLLFLLMTAIIPFSSTIDLFLAARFLQGMGLCFIFLGYAAIHEMFNDRDAVVLMSILANITIFAPLVGPIIGSGITFLFGWQYVFIITAILATISLLGLYFYMPTGNISASRIDPIQIAKNYTSIISNRIFFLGILINGLSIVPMISWIGLSPVMIRETLHLSNLVYLTCQSIIFCGFILSSILVKFIAGRFSFYQIIRCGSSISLFGLLLAAVCSWVGLYLMVGGFFIYAFGFGLYNGSLIRIALSSTKQTMAMTSAMMSLILGSFLVIGLETANRVTGYFNYSIISFASFAGVVAILSFVLVCYFSRFIRDRVWQ